MAALMRALACRAARQDASGRRPRPCRGLTRACLPVPCCTHITSSIPQCVPLRWQPTPPSPSSPCKSWPPTAPRTCSPAPPPPRCRRAYGSLRGRAEAGGEPLSLTRGIRRVAASPSPHCSPPTALRSASCLYRCPCLVLGVGCVAVLHPCARSMSLLALLASRVRRPARMGVIFFLAALDTDRWVWVDRAHAREPAAGARVLMRGWRHYLVTPDGY
jgi:hypothetical protein